MRYRYPFKVLIHFFFFWYDLRRGITGSYDSSISNILGNRHTVFYCGCISLQSFSPLTPHHELSFVFLIIASDDIETLYLALHRNASSGIDFLLGFS